MPETSATPGHTTRDPESRWSENDAAGALAGLAAADPALGELVRRTLVALARLPASEACGGYRQWRRRLRAGLTPLGVHLRAHPAAARRLVGWLFERGHRLLEDAAVWERELPGLPAPGAAPTTAVLDTALGLPPIPDDDALLREWSGRQARHGRQQIVALPSPFPAIRALAGQVALGPGEYVCDLGAGHGRVVLALALLGLPARGIELLPDRHAAAEAARRALRVEAARFDRGSVLEERFWGGPDTVADAGWYYCHDPFDDATHVALLDRLGVVARRRPVRLLAFVQTSRYRGRYQQCLGDGRLRLVWPAGESVSFGLHVFQAVGAERRPAVERAD